MSAAVHHILQSLISAILADISLLAAESSLASDPVDPVTRTLPADGLLIIDVKSSCVSFLGNDT